MSTPTPRTDAAWAASSEKLGFFMSDLASTLERELAALTAERDQLRAEVDRLKKQAVFDADHIHDLNAVFATRAEVERYRLITLRQDAELATERDKVRVLRSSLENLCDEQNGPPLEVNRDQWQLAMDESRLALVVTEGAK